MITKRKTLKQIIADYLETKGHHIAEYWDENGKLRIYVDGEYMNLDRLKWFKKRTDKGGNPCWLNNKI